MALGCQIARRTKWDRKSYYYPDLPKNYQISQYDTPLCFNGKFELADEGRPAQNHPHPPGHLEEDAGKLLHEAPGGHRIDFSIVDLNRAGTPLLEVVTEPDLKRRMRSLSSARNCKSWFNSSASVKARCRWATCASSRTSTSTSPTNRARCIKPRSPRSRTSTALASWSEPRRLRFNGRFASGKIPAIWAQEHLRLGRADAIDLFAKDQGRAHDYRYFPDPDLPVVEIDDGWLDSFRSKIGELPRRGESAINQPAFPQWTHRSLVGDRQTGELYDQAVADGGDAKKVANLILSHGRRIANERNLPLGQIGIRPNRLAEPGESDRRRQTRPRRTSRPGADAHDRERRLRRADRGGAWLDPGFGCERRLTPRSKP